MSLIEQSLSSVNADFEQCHYEIAQSWQLTEMINQNCHVTETQDIHTLLDGSEAFNKADRVDDDVVKDV